MTECILLAWLSVSLHSQAPNNRHAWSISLDTIRLLTFISSLSKFVLRIISLIGYYLNFKS